VVLVESDCPSMRRSTVDSGSQLEEEDELFLSQGSNGQWLIGSWCGEQVARSVTFL
jgi:hypothetical protein